MVNKNSKGCYKKARKKWISCSVFYVVPPTPVNYLTPSPPHLSHSEHQAGLDDVEDQVNLAPRERKPQKNYQIAQQIVFFSLELQLEGKQGPNLMLFELEPPGDPGEDIDDCINLSSPPPSHPPLHTGHDIEAPALHYLFPPLMYNVDPRDLLSLLPLSLPHVDQEDFPNKPQPVCNRKYHVEVPSLHLLLPPLMYNVDPRDLLPLLHLNLPQIDNDDFPNKAQPVSNRNCQLDLVLLESSLQEFSLTSLEDLSADCSSSPCLPEFLSVQTSPRFPRGPSCEPPPPSPSPGRPRQLPGLVVPPVPIMPSLPPYHPPGPGLDLPARGHQAAWLSPPQAVIFAPAQDQINFPSSNLKNFPARLKLSNVCSFIRPTVGLAKISGLPCHASPSPPQTPEFLQRKLSKAEDLFDQVRRHSRGIIFYR